MQYRKDTQNKNARVLKTSKEKVITLLKYAGFDNKKIKIYQKTRGKLLISSLEIKTPMSEISLFRNTCFSNEKILHKLQK